jgi:hypothetical protein
VGLAAAAGVAAVLVSSAGLVSGSAIFFSQPRASSAQQAIEVKPKDRSSLSIASDLPSPDPGVQPSCTGARG